jgi:hypothetical protein
MKGKWMGGKGCDLSRKVKGLMFNKGYKEFLNQVVFGHQCNCFYFYL